MVNTVWFTQGCAASISGTLSLPASTVCKDRVRIEPPPLRPIDRETIKRHGPLSMAAAGESSVLEELVVLRGRDPPHRHSASQACFCYTVVHSHLQGIAVTFHHQIVV